MSNPSLTGRQAAFVRLCAAGHPPAAAAGFAGYAPSAAERQARRLLRLPAVRQRLAELAPAVETYRQMPEAAVRAEFHARMRAALAAGRIAEGRQLALLYLGRGAQRAAARGVYRNGAK